MLGVTGDAMTGSDGMLVVKFPKRLDWSVGPFGTCLGGSLGEHCPGWAGVVDGVGEFAGVTEGLGVFDALGTCRFFFLGLGAPRVGAGLEGGGGGPSRKVSYQPQPAADCGS